MGTQRKEKNSDNDGRIHVSSFRLTQNVKIIFHRRKIICEFSVTFLCVSVS